MIRTTFERAIQMQKDIFQCFIDCAKTFGSKDLVELHGKSDLFRKQ